MDKNCFADISFKFKKTELSEIPDLPHMSIHCSLWMQECRDESEIYNYWQAHPSNDKFIKGILEGTLPWPGSTVVFYYG